MRRWLLIFICVFSSSLVIQPVASADPTPSPLAPLITNIPGRSTISLNGAWKAIVDPYENGVANKFYRNEVAKNKSERVEYSFDLSPVLNVPGDWNTQRADLMFYEGPIWYRRTFEYRKRPGGRTFIYFGAVNYRAVVYLNGEKLGEHEGGFTPFDFEATTLLHDGNNFLIVEVDNIRRAGSVPAMRTDWWNYGGITRDVMLVEVPSAFIQDYCVQLAKGKLNQIEGWVQLAGVAGRQSISLDIPEAGLHERITTDAAGRAEFRIAAKLELWSPEQPKLYAVTLHAGASTIRDEIGFRTIEVQGGKILLNGKPIFLRGISMHEEAPFRDGRAFSSEDAQTLLGWAKDLRCNFVRLAHYPHNENEVRLADRMGLLLWSEIPVYWDIDWQNAATLTEAEHQLRETITRDRNRASVIFWSVSNETPVKEERTAFLKQLVQLAREMDSTRLITSAMNHTDRTGPEERTLTDPLGDVLDVLGINEYVGWYEGKPESADKITWKSKWDKPVIVSEFGGGAQAGLHGSADEIWTEEFQANLYWHQLGMVQRMPNFAGMTPWVLMDFRSPARMLPGIQDYHNRKGLLSNRGERKEAFYVLRKFYEDRAAAEK